MNGLKLLATGRCLPAAAVTNEDMRRYVDTSDEWITTRTGIRQRYFCAEGENALTLASGAARQALADSGIPKEELGCVVCATVSADYATPSLSCLVQAELGLPEEIPVLDLNAACSGFLYAVAVARGLLAQNGKKYALIIGCEVLSRLMNMSDRSTCVLFGDGAGAAVFEAGPDFPFYALQGARGDKAILANGPGPLAPDLSMDGRAVFRFAVEALPHCIQGIQDQSGLSLEKIDWVVCHQANERIIDHCVKKLKAPAEKFYKNMARYGNTSAASIPIALDEMNRDGKLKPGQKILCVGFGGGLTWAAALFTI
ncbi:ketoacyl-ACP synthase III [Fournierella massiliensis]|nr:beta-ketoacyl-ACP synthase III [Fournierella massiliensis]MCF2556446.1 ketoacyl-ACP synthase III [Fournierella massiliensis]